MAARCFLPGSGKKLPATRQFLPGFPAFRRGVPPFFMWHAPC